MTDIGFGLIDRRTVIVIIVSMVLAERFFGTVIPVNTSNVSTLFFDIVLLTGYVYAGRSILRFPVALLAGFGYSVVLSTEAVEWPKQKYGKEPTEPSMKRRVFGVLQKVLTGLKIYSMRTVITILLLPVKTLNFEQIIYYARKRQRERERIMGYPESFDFTIWSFSALDRVGVVAIAALATMPQFNLIYMRLGYAGLMFMLFIYVFSGSFTSIIRDMLSFQEDDDTNRVQVESSYEKPMYVKIVG